MLLSYRFNNFCSFWGDNEFSLEAPSGKVRRRYPDNYTEMDNGYSGLKTAVIVGENAGGKSNFMHSLLYLKSLFAENATVRSFPAYINYASQKKEENPRQRFELELSPEDETVYRYVLVIDATGILQEELYSRQAKKSKEELLLRVERDDSGRYEITGKLKEKVPSISEQKQSGLGLFITKMAILGIEPALSVTNWMNETLYAEKLGAEEISIGRLQSDLEILRDPRYTEIFRMVDYSICGMELDDEKPYSKTMVLRKDKSGNIQKRELSMDSAGVREFFAWAVQIFRVVYQDKVIMADEMDRVLNPILSDRVISYINGKQHRGQFVFSTHNVLHLNLTTYLKEQIYFVTKDKDTLISEIYSLADFPEVRYETTKIYEFYMKGILGGTSDE